MSIKILIHRRECECSAQDYHFRNSSNNSIHAIYLRQFLCRLRTSYGHIYTIPEQQLILLYIASFINFVALYSSTSIGSCQVRSKNKCRDGRRDIRVDVPTLNCIESTLQSSDMHDENNCISDL